MDSRVLVLAAVVLASGCTQLPGDLPSGGPSTDTGGKGLEVTEFTVSDDTLQPGQEAFVTATLKNHHREDISLLDVSLYNLGFLEVVNPGKTFDERCNPELRPAREGISPEVECRWRIKAPEEPELKGIESKPVTVKMNLEYNSRLSNSGRPFKLQFRKPENIGSRSEKKATYSNGEVRMTVSAENPAPLTGTVIEFRLENAGQGRVASEYVMSYTPSQVFGKDCPVVKEQVVEDRAEFSCTLSPDSDTELVRNLILATSYKYVKAPNLDIEVVNK